MGQIDYWREKDRDDKDGLMKIFEYDVLTDLSNGGRPIPATHAVRFWLDANSFIEIRAGDHERGGKHILVRASGHQTQLQIEPEVSNTIRVGLK